VWFWLARIIRGSSQQVSTKRGVDKGSVAKIGLRLVHPDSATLVSHERLKREITRLCPRVTGHSHLGGAIQVVGISIRVGIKIFNIAGGLGFGAG